MRRLNNLMGKSMFVPFIGKNILFFNLHEYMYCLVALL